MPNMARPECEGEEEEEEREVVVVAAESVPAAMSATTLARIVSGRQIMRRRKGSTPTENEVNTEEKSSSITLWIKNLRGPKGKKSSRR